MKSFITAAALVALIPSVMGLTIDSPQNVVECQPFQFTWSGGTPPYFLSLIPSAGADPIKQFPQQTGTTFTWTVDLQANTNFIAALKDNTGTQAFAAQASIISGSDTSCLNTAVQDSGTGGASGGAASTSAPSGSASATGGSTTGKATGTASGSASTPTSSTGAALGSSVSAFGVAGVFGLVGAVLF